MTISLQNHPTIAVVIPSYRRGPIVCETIAQLLFQSDKPEQIIVVDQTKYAQDDGSYLKLKDHHERGEICFLQLEQPSIPVAMNVGLRDADSDYVLYLDDDIHIDDNFISAHRDELIKHNSKEKEPLAAQVGQVLQPGECPDDSAEFISKYVGIERDLDFKFNSSKTSEIENCMAGNFCVNRDFAIAIGGFDENFQGAAYRFETEFARRLCLYTSQKIRFTPSASIRHLQWQSGGTRSHANHLSSSSPSHSAGDYYFSFLQASGKHRLKYQFRRLLLSLKAKFYLRRPWFIPVRVLAEWRGYKLAKKLWKNGPKLIREEIRLPRLAVLMSHPTQHFAPVYRALAANKHINVKVFFLSETGLLSYHDPGFSEEVQWDVPLNQGYQHEFLSPGKILKSFSFSEMDHEQVQQVVGGFFPDMIWLHGYGQKANWRIAFNPPHQAEIIYTSDSNIDDQRAWYKQIIKKLVVRAFLRRCDYYFSFSKRNERYLLQYGASQSKIISTRFPVDIERWQGLSDSFTPEHQRKVREALGVKEAVTIFLFAGKLERHKGAHEAIQALHSAQREDQCLLIVGSGSERGSLQSLVESLRLETRVIFIGFKNQSELAEYFAVSDVLVFPSHREPYGAIAAEVLPFGLPIIAASGIGSIGSAIVENQNAVLYPAGDVQALANAMCKLSDQAVFKQYSQASKAMAPEHDKSILCEKIIKVCCA